MSEDIVSDYFVTLSLDGGKIRFGESGRAWDERGHDMVVVQLPSQPLMFGEWRPRWAANQNDFDVDIVTFGFPRAFIVGSPDPKNRRTVTTSERLTIKELVRALFANAEAGVSPFTSRKGKFLGHVHFLPDGLEKLTRGFASEQMISIRR